MSDVEREAKGLVYTSVGDSISSAFHASIAVIKYAVHIELGRPTPRISLIRGLTAELRRKERAAAAAPKDAA